LCRVVEHPPGDQTGQWVDRRLSFQERDQFLLSLAGGGEQGRGSDDGRVAYPSVESAVGR
jgi:hypothetical protein